MANAILLIGDKISVTIVRISGGGVRLGIEAPPEMAVIREELKIAMEKMEKAENEISSSSIDESKSDS